MKDDYFKNRFLVRVIIVILVGLFAYVIDSWGSENDEIYGLFLRIPLYTLVIIAALSDATRGKFKSSPRYKATFNEAVQLRLVQIFMAFYLMGAFLILLKAIGGGTDTYDFLSHPFHQYLFFAPLFVVVYLGMYIIEKNHCEE